MAISNSKAFIRLKAEQQKVFDFMVTVCHAVPALKEDIKEYRNGSRAFIFRPDFFPENSAPVDRLETLVKDYKHPLSKYLFLSIFSFFEAYISDVIEELFEFHGEKNLIEILPKALLSASSDVSIKADKAKLSEYPKVKNIQRYKKHINIIQRAGAPKPSSLLSAYGFRRLREVMGKDYQSLKSVDIPKVMSEVFLFNFSDAEVIRFDSLRKSRNKIAHGKNTNMAFSDVMDLNEFLRSLAVKIDKHLLDHYFLIEFI